MLDKLLNQYIERFDENFPTEFISDEDEIIMLIQTALDEGKPYEPQYEDGVVY